MLEKISRKIAIALTKLIASNRLIEFGSINQPKSWQFELTRLKSLGESISKVEIEYRINSSQFQ